MQTRETRLRSAICRIIHDEKLYRVATLTRGDVMCRLGISKNLFVEVFRRSFGVSFTEYVNRLRLEEALTLLQTTDLSIGEVSEKTGFGTTRTFRRQFHSKYGLSPIAFRKQQEGNREV